MTEKIAILGHVVEAPVARLMAELKAMGRTVEVVDDMPERSLDINPPMFPIYANERFDEIAVIKEPRVTVGGSTINQRKRRKYARQNPHSKYAK